MVRSSDEWRIAAWAVRGATPFLLRRGPGVARRRALRHVEIDTNYWKTFVHERLGTAMGDAGCLSVFGRRFHPGRGAHRGGGEARGRQKTTQTV